MPKYYSAEKAAQYLGVSRQTLYSYVSRGLLRAHKTDHPRERRYLVDEVTQLARKRAHGRKPREVAKDALNWGLPVIESSICLIAGGRLYYRGKDVLNLIESHSVEEVAALLWECPVETAFGSKVGTSATNSRKAKPDSDSVSGMSLLSRFVLSSKGTHFHSWEQDPGRASRGHGELLRLFATCLLHTPTATEPLHRQCAAAWHVNARNSDLIRKALILCADHELNASSFTVRCIVSTGTSLPAAIVGGLAALTGGHHGGTTYRLEALLNEIANSKYPETSLLARLNCGQDLPGFGHPLYPEGDVRATALLDDMPKRHSQWRKLAAIVEHLTGLRPSVDFALVALRRHLQLPEGVAFGLFALGRIIGWIAHALEQRQRGQLIRPRAAYIGVAPEEPAVGVPFPLSS